MTEKETLEARVVALEKKHRDDINALAESGRKLNGGAREFFEQFASFVLDKLESHAVLGETKTSLRYEESCRFGSAVFDLEDWDSAIKFLETLGLQTHKYRNSEAIVSLKNS